MHLTGNDHGYRVQTQTQAEALSVMQSVASHLIVADMAPQIETSERLRSRPAGARGKSMHQPAIALGIEQRRKDQRKPIDGLSPPGSLYLRLFDDISSGASSGL